MEKSQLVDFYIIIAMVVIMVFAFPILTGMYWRLKKKHPEAYEDLGRPSWKNSQAWWSKGYWSWIFFIYGDGYKILDDPLFNKLRFWFVILNTIFHIFLVFMVFRHFIKFTAG